MPAPPVHLIAAATLVSAAAIAQCVNTWAVDAALPLPALVSDSALWDPDGPGPLAPRLVVGGSLQSGSAVFGAVAAFDDSAGVWQQIGVWYPALVLAVATGASGQLFATVASIPTIGPWTHRVMQWNGVAWSQLGGTFDGQVITAAVAANGDLIVGGGFTTVGAVAIANVARWDGSSWNPIGNGITAYCDELLVMPNGDVVAGGLFGVARWDGFAWSQVGASPGWALALAALPNGDLVAGLAYDLVVRWDGTNWIPLGGAVLPQSFGNIEALAVLPNGDLMAAEGSLTGGGTHSRLARWDGVSWTSIGITNGAVRTLTVRPATAYDVVAGGNFTNVNGLATFGVARMTTTCPPSVKTIASGCVSGSSLAAEPAWVGGVWHATAKGLPQPAFVIGASGVVPVVAPLSSLLASAVTGCTLHVQPDVLELLVAVNGVASANWVIPNTVALVGASFRHQMIALQYSSGMAIVSAVATDAAQLRIGAL